MIDIDKYEGHLMDGDFQVWSWSRKMLKVANYEEQMATAALLKDTPLLLAEVQRMREEVSSVIECMLAESEESPSWGVTVHAYIKDLQRVIE